MQSGAGERRGNAEPGCRSQILGLGMRGHTEPGLESRSSGNAGKPGEPVKTEINSKKPGLESSNLTLSPRGKNSR